MILMHVDCRLYFEIPPIAKKSVLIKTQLNQLQIEKISKTSHQNEW